MKRRMAITIALVVFLAYAGVAQNRTASALTSPKEQFGHDIGDDYCLVNYTQYVEYLQKLDKESDRMTVVDIGKTAEGRPECTAIITSPENHKKLAQVQGDQPPAGARRGAHRRSGAAARARRQDGRLDRRRPSRDRGARRAAAHRNDLSAQHRAPMPRRLRILNDDIVLCTLVNPDGMELVSNWYMREPGRAAAIDQRHPAALPEVHRPRQQPRLLHDEPAGEREREPDHVPRVVPGDHVQPSPDRAGRRGAVRAAVPRSVQLQLRSARFRSASTWSARRFTRGSPSRTSRAR